MYYNKQLPIFEIFILPYVSNPSGKLIWMIHNFAFSYYILYAGFFFLLLESFFLNFVFMIYILLFWSPNFKKLLTKQKKNHDKHSPLLKDERDDNLQKEKN